MHTDKKEEAAKLRELGYSYKEIADQTGYSLDWCKRNLKIVQKNKNEKQAIKQAIELAQSKDGITNGEIKQLIRTVYNYEPTKEYETIESKALARFKTAINKEQSCIIRPYWMQPQSALTSFRLILDSVNSMSQSMDESVDYVRKQLDLDQSSDISIRYTIIKMLFGSGLVPEGLENYCDRLSDIANKLEEINDLDSCGLGECTFQHTLNTCTKKCAPKKPSSKKCTSVEIHQNDEIDLDYINNLLMDAYEPN